MLKYKQLGFKIEFESYNPDYVDKLGRVIKRGKRIAVNAHYLIRVTDPEGNTLAKEFCTAIPPELILG